MKDSVGDQQESTDRKLIKDISQLNKVSLGEGAATCQVCGSSFHEGDAVVVYVFRPAEEVMFQVGYTVCGDGRHEPPTEFTLGVRELLVEGRVGRCADVTTQSSWPVLLAPEVVVVSAAATKSARRISSGDRVRVNSEARADKGPMRQSPVAISRGEARRRADRADTETERDLKWSDQR